MLTPSDLHSYQRDAINFALNKKSFGLFLPMGLGKTTITLTIINNRKRNSPGFKSLIVAPKSVATNVWPNEHRKWSHLDHLNVCRYDPTTTDVEIKTADIVVIHFEQMEKFFNRVPFALFTTLVIDESSRIKNAGSQRFKILKQAAKAIPSRVILTGTPMPQGLQDLWTQIGVLDYGERLGRSLTAFRTTYLEPDKINPRNKIVWKWRAKAGAEKDVINKISDIVLSIDRDSNLKMPDLTVSTHTIKWDERTQLAYKTFVDDMVLELTGEDTITAVSAGALVNKLVQFTSGNVYDEEGEAIPIHTHKLDYLVDLLEDAPPTIIFYHYKSSLAAIKSAVPHAKEYNNNPQVLTDWTAGKVPVLLLHPQSAGLGLNLQCNTAKYSQIMWYDLPWSGELYQQANGRLYRQGQEKPVVIHHLTMQNSIDEKVLQVLDKKISLEGAVLSELCIVVNTGDETSDDGGAIDR